MEILRVCGVEPDLRAVELPITPGAEWRTDLTGPPLGQDVPSAGPTTVSPGESSGRVAAWINNASVIEARPNSSFVLIFSGYQVAS